MCITGGLGILARKNAREMTCCTRKSLVGWQIKTYHKIWAHLDGTSFAHEIQEIQTFIMTHWLTDTYFLHPNVSDCQQPS